VRVTLAPSEASVAFTATAKVPDSVALPEMTPVVGAMERPAGRPVAVQVTAPMALVAAGAMGA
jgi:hypothetical protein